MSELYIGCDLGQVRDYTAISILEATMPDRRTWHFNLRYLERPPLGTSYPDIARKLLQITKKLPRARLVVDQTGVGRGVVDIMREMDLYPVGVTIGGGTGFTKASNGIDYHVSKIDLVFSLVAVWQAGRMVVADAIPLRDTLIHELHNLKPKPPRPGSTNLTIEAYREQDHDDIVLSVALATWYAMTAPTWLIN